MSQGQRHANNVSKILAGDYVPLHIHSKEVDCGPIACMKTTIIMIVRAFPLNKIRTFFNCRQGCFVARSIQPVLINKHLFIQFDAWVYDGSDVLWAALMEKLWTAVEAEFGYFAVRRHRASIRLAGEKADDSNPKHLRVERRELALFKFKAIFFVSSVLF